MSDEQNPGRAIVPYNPEPEASEDQETRAMVPAESPDNKAPAQNTPPGTKVLTSPPPPPPPKPSQPSPPRKSRVGQTKPLVNKSLDTGLPQRVQFYVRESGEIMELGTSGAIMIGRRSSTLPVDVDLADFGAQDLGVSRNHMLIEPNGNRLIAKDLNSVNGSRLNGQRMRPLSMYELRHGDELKLGKIHLKVYFIY